MSFRSLGTRRSSRLTTAVLTTMLVCAAVGARAQVTTYSTRAAFNAAAPSTAMINFEAGAISNPANGASFEDPLWEGTDNGVFSPGDIPPGITFVNSCSTSGNLILAGVGFDLWGWSGTGGFPSKVLMPAGDACSLKIIFTPPVDAVALDIFAESDDGFRLSVYGFAGTFTRHIDGTAGQTSPGFIGVTSDLPIGNVVMKAPSGTSTGAFEAADRISFGDLPLFADGFESHDTSAWSTSMGD